MSISNPSYTLARGYNQPAAATWKLTNVTEECLLSNRTFSITSDSEFVSGPIFEKKVNKASAKHLNYTQYQLSGLYQCNEVNIYVVDCSLRHSIDVYCSFG